jgi:DNA-binding NarL/FixJ family response regulator
MTYPTLKISIKIGIAAALAIILFQVSNILLVYKYFKFDYYITAVAVLFLIAGFFTSKYKRTDQKKDPEENLLLTLTSKESAILQMIAEGKSNKEIASINFVEVSTIKTHINNIYTKLGLQNRREAILYYRGKL